jgi:hypothetical protein
MCEGGVNGGSTASSLSNPLVYINPLFARIALMMDAVNTSETTVSLYQTTRHISEDSHLHTRRRENLKS